MEWQHYALSGITDVSATRHDTKKKKLRFSGIFRASHQDASAEPAKLKVIFELTTDLQNRYLINNVEVSLILHISKYY